jgi:class 3 adenylate cyclase/HAMP domain-containing protein
MEKQSTFEVRISLKTKLFSLLVAVAGLSVLVNTYTSIDLFNKDKIAYIYQANSVLTQSLATEVEARLSENVKILHLASSFISTQGKNARKLYENEVLSVLRNAADVIFCEMRLEGNDGAPPLFSYTDTDFVKQRSLDSQFIAQTAAAHPFPVKQLDVTPLLFFDASAIDKRIALLGTVMKARSKYATSPDVVVTAYLKTDALLKAFSNVTDYTTFLADDAGHLMIHPNADILFQKSDYSTHPLISEAIRNGSPLGAREYSITHGGEAFLGAFKKLRISPLYVVSEIPKEKALLASRRLMEKNLIFGFGVISFAVLVAIFFSRALTESLRKLYDVTRKIARGQFDVNVNVKNRDEVGALAHAFNSMSVELSHKVDEIKQVTAQNANIKTTFSRYVAPAIVDKVLKDPQSLKFGGERREISMFFSDVRDFTTLSEKMNIQQLTDSLRRYMSTMTDIVFDTHGTLDKYIGDAIVALWGAPVPVEDHADQAVSAGVRMLTALGQINESFQELGYPQFQIGIGINTGEVSVGNMGSEKIFSYTAIGDAMNLASRMEGLCKHYTSRMLISENTYKKLPGGHTYRIRAIDRAVVKGKSEPITVYEVLDPRGHFFSILILKYKKQSLL